ncbi:aldo/keto reductase [Blautia hominis]|uniref:Aldo/keto reductase n=1 Tax=Blautia hominis TaxID=2025493 RepID=A0ABQ0BD30_9FIRM
MEYTRFGKTELKVSEIGFGAWAIGGSGWGEGCDDALSMEALACAWEEGVNLFDTCDSYGNGHSEELIGKFLAGKRHEAVIVTKGGTNFRVPERSKNFTREYLKMCLDESLKRLQTDYVDVYLLHVPDAGWQDKEQVLDTMKELKQSGKARFCGLAMWGAADTLHAFEKDKEGVIEALECPFNILNKSNLEVVEIARQRDIPVLTSQPLASGILTGKYAVDTKFLQGDNRAGFWTAERFAAVEKDMEIIRSCIKEPVQNMAQLALAYALNYPGISCVIPGAKNASQVKKNVSASGIVLDASVMEKLKGTEGFVF